MGNWFNFAVNARHGGMRNFAAQEIKSRKGRGSDHQDMLEKFLNVQKEYPKEMNDTNVLSMTTSNINAGSDTTAISIRSIIYYLLKNPEYMQKLVDEIDTRQKEGKITEPISLEQTKGMPYLQACMYEGLRCHPAVGMSLPRVTPAGGIEIDGRYIPEGTVVGVNPWVVHRDKSVFGEDAESFRPDRWLNTDTSEMGTYLALLTTSCRTANKLFPERFFFAFGSGARLCLGKSMLSCLDEDGADSDCICF